MIAGVNKKFSFLLSSFPLEILPAHLHAECPIRTDLPSKAESRQRCVSIELFWALNGCCWHVFGIIGLDSGLKIGFIPTCRSRVNRSQLFTHNDQHHFLINFFGKTIGIGMFCMLTGIGIWLVASKVQNRRLRALREIQERKEMLKFPIYFCPVFLRLSFPRLKKSIKICGKGTAIVLLVCCFNQGPKVSLLHIARCYRVQKVPAAEHFCTLIRATVKTKLSGCPAGLKRSHQKSLVNRTSFKQTPMEMRLCEAAQ